MRILIIVPAVLALLVLSSSSHVEASPGVTTRVSVASDGAQSNAASYDPAISADGRFVAFWSVANNLVAGDANSFFDVFVHDLLTGETARASVDSGGGEANSASFRPALSADGRFVLFDSNASNLVVDDTNGAGDVFVHDRQSGETTRVSVDSAGVQGNHNSGGAAVSADGRFVAFGSRASNLVMGDTNNFCDLDGDNVYNENCYDIFVRDRQTSETTRVSVDSAGGQTNGISYEPAISADGRFIVFLSFASNLVAGDSNTCGYGGPGTCPDVFLHDRQTGTTTRVSVSSGGGQANDGSYSSDVSADGRFVAFDSAASNLAAGDTNQTSDAFVHDGQTGATTRVSVTSAGDQANNGSCCATTISADGRYVAFESGASNLVEGDTNDCDPFNCSDVFVHDRQTGETSRVSVDSAGGQANDDSGFSAISADGRFVVFESYASNLVTSDANGISLDIFVHDLGDMDSDGEWDPFDPDDDNDGLNDVEDICPLDPDCDNDTVLDAADNCPLVENAAGQLADIDGDMAGDACDAPGTGNVDCSQAVNSVDALKVLRFSAGLSVAQSEPCLDIGAGPLLSGWMQGDVNCSAGAKPVNAVDALLILRRVAELSVNIPGLCPPIIGPPP